jgi:DNA-binding protein H-NS
MTQTIQIEDVAMASLEELRAAQKAIREAIRGKQDAVQAERARELQTLAQRYGLTVRVSSLSPPKSKRPAKYQHPENPYLTWGGRGTRPRWFKALEEQGMNRNDLLLPQDL